MKLSDFDYELPAACIAQQPAEPRDAARLLVYCKADGALLHRRVSDLATILNRGDLLVVNDTRVMMARLVGRRSTGGAVELLVLGLPCAPHQSCRVLVKPAGRLKPGERIELEGGALVARMLERERDQGGRVGPVWSAEIADPGQPARPLAELLERCGRVPLPPYIHRPANSVEHARSDRERYQTIFADQPGAVAAPTAGLHFTSSLLDELFRKGIDVASVTLHVGIGTFQTITESDITKHRMHHERYVLAQATVDAIGRARARNDRVIAVGTTVVRVLESCAADDGTLAAGQGETGIYIRPGHRFRVIDGLLTNFHLPRSTLLVLVSAFLDRKRVLDLYQEAISLGYRFYSYGDAMLLIDQR